eukprot:GHUV01032968.1.p1 GENE.GHUV01032968.1~~GHUV01032968.1.p1  ORF type:complete len:433 (+),score=120.36 GHUV01032968.1:261-1559(+)
MRSEHVDQREALVLVVSVYLHGATCVSFRTAGLQLILIILLLRTRLLRPCVACQDASCCRSRVQQPPATLSPWQCCTGMPVLTKSSRHLTYFPPFLTSLIEPRSAAIVLCDNSWRHQSMMQSLHFSNPAAAAAAAADSHSAAYSSGSPGSSLGSEGVATTSNAQGLPGYPSTNGYGGGLGGAAAAAGVYGAAATGFGDADVLQLDALLLRVQLNLRSMLQEIGREKEVNIITEKVGTEQETRFEDKSKLPLGVPVNLSSYTACIMSQLAFCPMMVLPRTLGAQIDPLIVDADLYTAVGDKVSFWQLMRRAQLLGHVLLGYYLLPVAAQDPIEAVICPPGDTRYEQKVWNTGDNRLKFIVLQDAASARARDGGAAGVEVASAAAGQAGAATEKVRELLANAEGTGPGQDVWKKAADATSMYFPVDGGWQWRIR